MERVLSFDQDSKTIWESWLQKQFSNPLTTDLCLNGDRSVFFDQGNGMESTPLPSFVPIDTIKSWVVDQLALQGKSWDAKYPFADFSIPMGLRIHAVFPPIAKSGILVSFRKIFNAENNRKDQAIARWNHFAGWNLLMDAILRGDSILISGATGSGKTTLASDLLSFVPPEERILALEDTPELCPEHPHFISLISRPPNADGFGEITLRTLLKQTLRMRPDRIVLGECRGAEVLDLLQTLNTGHRGAIATLHAHSPRDALKRIELLCHLAGGPTTAVLRDLIAGGLKWLIQVEKSAQGRQICSLMQIDGREGETILLRPIEPLK